MARWCARNVPGVIEQGAITARQLAKLRDDYVHKHWGDAGDVDIGASTTARTDSGLVMLGHLHKIEYLTLKGREDEPAIYSHVFGGGRDLEPGDRLPILCLGPDEVGRRNALVIVRGDSLYTVTDRGIVG